LTASTTVTANSASGANVIALRNPTGKAMDILEVKFALRMVQPAGGNPFGCFGGAVACKMDLGKIPLSGGFVPVWCFGRADNLQTETRFGTLTQGSGVVITSYFDGSWKLPRPLYIPAGAVVSAAFQHLGLFQYDVQARISYSGRTHADGEAPPKTICVPYAAAFRSKVMDASAVNSDASTEADLANPFSEPIQLQRFVGRVMTIPSTLAQSSFEVGYPTIGHEMMKVRMVDSHGRPIIGGNGAGDGAGGVQDFASFRQAFGAETRSWEMENGAVLEPDGYYIASLKQDVALAGVPDSGVLLSQAQIAFNGWREVSGEGA
jgi:hypothetical protein